MIALEVWFVVAAVVASSLLVLIRVITTVATAHPRIEKLLS